MAASIEFLAHNWEILAQSSKKLLDMMLEVGGNYIPEN